MNKSIEYVEPEDDTKDGTQEDISTEDEEQVDDIDETESKDDVDSEDEEVDDEKDSGKKTFKTREERAEFFKNKKKKVIEKDKSDDVLTKADLYKMNEARAIKNLTEISPDDSPDVRQYKTFVDERWNDIVPHINMRTVNKLDVESYEKAIRRAVIIVKSEDPEEEDTTDVDTRKRIMQDVGVKGSSGKGTPAKKTTILGNTGKGMDDWFPKKD